MFVQYLFSSKCWNVEYMQKSKTNFAPPTGVRFDFQKFCLIFAPCVSIIIFCIKKDLEEASNLYVENWLDAKCALLLCKIMNFWQFCQFYYIKWHPLRPDSLKFLELKVLLGHFFRYKIRWLRSPVSKNQRKFRQIETPYPTGDGGRRRRRAPGAQHTQEPPLGVPEAEEDAGGQAEAPEVALQGDERDDEAASGEN